MCDHPSFVVREGDQIPLCRCTECHMAFNLWDAYNLLFIRINERLTALDETVRRARDTFARLGELEARLSSKPADPAASSHS